MTGTVDCPACNGAGFFLCAPRRQAKCNECNGTGEIEVDQPECPTIRSIRARLLATTESALKNAERDTLVFGREFHLTIAASALKAVRELEN